MTTAYTSPLSVEQDLLIGGIGGAVFAYLLLNSLDLFQALPINSV